MLHKITPLILITFVTSLLVMGAYFMLRTEEKTTAYVLGESETEAEPLITEQQVRAGLGKNNYFTKAPAIVHITPFEVKKRDRVRFEGVGFYGAKMAPAVEESSLNSTPNIELWSASEFNLADANRQNGWNSFDPAWE